MPNYDYICFKCKALYEIMVTYDDLETEIKCPECESNLKRMVSAPAFQFK